MEIWLASSGELTAAVKPARDGGSVAISNLPAVKAKLWWNCSDQVKRDQITNWTNQRLQPWQSARLTTHVYKESFSRGQEGRGHRTWGPSFTCQGEPPNHSLHIPWHHLREGTVGKRGGGLFERVNILFQIWYSSFLNNPPQYFWIIQSLYPDLIFSDIFSPLTTWWGNSGPWMRK